MKHAYRFFLLGTFLFVSPMGQAEAPDDTIDRLVEVSGVSEQVGNLPGLVKASLRGAEYEGEPLPVQTLAAMATRADELIVPAEMATAMGAPNQSASRPTCRKPMGAVPMHTESTPIMRLRAPDGVHNRMSVLCIAAKAAVPSPVTHSSTPDVTTQPESAKASAESR